jgi:16S rRNA (cytidine1402-2'-O)-methyltransferase
MPGTLFVVATPIGNLEDITLRALRTLREVDLIAAEDTRRTSNLLAHYEIRRKLTSLHEHNERRETDRLVQRLLAGESIALVSDAGTPGIADPGGFLVRAARDAGVPVVPVPGPSAITAALSVSGYVADSFVFLGFPPSSGAARERWWDTLAAESRLCVFFEAPHRIKRALAEATARLGQRHISTFREMSKVYEELVESPSIAGSAADAQSRGEYTVVVAPQQDSGERTDGPSQTEVFSLFRRLVESAGLSSEAALGILASHFGIAIKEIAKMVKKASILAKRQNDATP